MRLMIDDAAVGHGERVRGCLRPVVLNTWREDVVDFAGFVRDEIEAIEKAQPAKK
jgi:hypothetical protein